MKVTQPLQEQLKLYFSSVDIGRPLRPGADWNAARDKLLHTLGSRVRNTTNSFEKQKEARRIAESVRAAADWALGDTE